MTRFTARAITMGFSFCGNFFPFPVATPLNRENNGERRSELVRIRSNQLSATNITSEVLVHFSDSGVTARAIDVPIYYPTLKPNSQFGYIWNTSNITSLLRLSTDSTEAISTKRCLPRESCGATPARILKSSLWRTAWRIRIAFLRNSLGIHGSDKLIPFQSWWYIVTSRISTHREPLRIRR